MSGQKELQFDGNSMLMYAWVADTNFTIRSINKSLNDWIQHCANNPFNPVDMQLKDFFFRLFQEEDRMVGGIIQDKLMSIRDGLPILLKSLQEMPQKLLIEDESTGNYSIIKTINLVENEKLLAGIRLVKPGGIRLNGGNDQDLVDFISVCLIDRAEDGWQVKGFQGQLQEAWQRVSAVREEATKAAVAAIMARNMSHNIGSHVLARVSNSDTLEQAVFSKAFLNAVVKAPQLDTDLVLHNIDTAMSQVAQLNAALRMRMDFVADIATAQSPPPPTRVSFIAEILLPFVGQRLVWSNLCASHNLTHKELLFRVIINETVTELRAGNQSEPPSLDPQAATAAIGVPNGAVGCQAFYCIVENFVRNAVKHLERPGQQELKISICLYTEGDWEDNKRLKKVTIHDNWQACRDNNKLVNILNKSLGERLIRDDGSLVTSNRGLKEMKATAAYLRRLPPKAVDDPNIKPPLLQAVNIDGNLGYELYLLRPKDLLVMAANIPSTGQNLLLFKKHGVEIVTSVDAVLEKASDYSMLWLKDASKEEIETIRAHAPDLPIRVIVQDENEVMARCGAWETTIPASSAKQISDGFWDSLLHGQGITALACAWELWIKLLCQHKPAKLGVFDNQTEWNIGNISRLIKEDDEFDDSEDIVLYAWHGYSNNADLLFYEPYGKGGVDPIALVFDNPPQNEDARKTLAYQLMETGLFPLIILDERVQEAAHVMRRTGFSRDPNDGREMAFWHSRMRIYVPSKQEIDLDSKQLTKQQIETWMNQIIQNLPPTMDLHP